jgi:hypothetical protein
MSETEYQAEVAEYIRSRGVTRCPTVCLAPTQGAVPVSERLALRQRAQRREELREEKFRNNWRNMFQPT